MCGTLGAAGMVGRVNAGIEAEAFLDEHVECPQAVVRDRETRRPIGGDGNADGILEHVARAPQIQAKGRRRLLVDEAVPVPVAGDLVARGVDATDEARIPLSDPAKDEECRLDGGIFEQIEDRLGAGLDARRELIPLFARDQVLESADVVVVFDIHGQGVERRWFRLWRGVRLTMDRTE